MYKAVRVLLVLGSLATIAGAYFSYQNSWFVSGDFLHDNITRLAFGDSAGKPTGPAAAAQVINPGAYPDLYRFVNQLRIASDDGSIGARSEYVPGWGSATIAEVEHAHFAPKTDPSSSDPDMSMLYWMDNESLWESKAFDLYSQARYADAYRSFGFALHLYQDSTVPAHPKIIFHGPNYFYNWAFKGQPLGSYRTDSIGPQGDNFEEGASRRNASFMQFSSGPGDYFNAAYHAAWCNVDRKYWLDRNDPPPAKAPNVCVSSTGQNCAGANSWLWGSYGDPQVACGTPNAYSDDDYFCSPACSVTQEAILGKGLYYALKLTSDRLKYYSEHLPPVVPTSAIAIRNGDLSKGLMNVDFQVHDNRLPTVKVSVLLADGSRPIRASLNGAPAASMLQTLWYLGNLPGNQAKTNLPYAGAFSLQWDGTLADGSRAPSGQGQLDVQVLDGDGNQTDLRVPVTIPYTTVAPAIALSPVTLSLTADQGTNPASQAITVSNSGAGTLAFTATATTAAGGSWLVVSPTSGTAPATLQVSVNSASLAAATYSGTITVASTSPGVTNSPQVVSVSLVVGPGPGGACCGPEPSLSVTVDPGFYIASSTIQAGGAEGYWEMSVDPQKDQRGGGFIFGGGIQEKGMTPYFAAFLLSSPQEVLIQLNPRLLPGGDASKFLACARLLDGKRQQIGTERCSTVFIEFRQTLPPDFYIIEVRTSGLSPRAYFEFLLGEKNLPPGLIVGGFLSAEVPGFIAFSVAQRQEVRIKAAGRCAFGAFAARCLRVTLYDSNRNIVAVSDSAGH